MNFGKHLVWIRNVFVDVRANDDVKTTVSKGKCKRVCDLEVEIRSIERSLRMRYGFVVDVDTHYTVEALR